MNRQVYSEREFIIVRVSKGGFLVINKKKGFKTGHTHLESFKTAKYILHCALYKRIPSNLPLYLLTSLTRVSDDDEYINQINELVKTKKRRKQAPVKRVGTRRK